MSQKHQSRNNRTLIDYCERFAELKVNRTRKQGNAPYKPILLLAVIELIDSLVSAWFASKQSKLQKIIKANQDFKNLSDEETDEPRYSLKKLLIRNALFRKDVVHLYGYKCAFCGLKVTRTLSQNIVYGAHIKPLSKFYDNQLNNGISFCKNHHWAFDRGLFTIDTKYNIVVSKNFDEISPNAKPIKEFQSLSIQLPNEINYYPRSEGIQWHQNNVLIS